MCQEKNTRETGLSFVCDGISCCITWILHESEAFIGKAPKDDVVVLYFESLATQHMKASGSPEG